MSFLVFDLADGMSLSRIEPVQLLGQNSGTCRELLYMYGKTQNPDGSH